MIPNIRNTTICKYKTCFHPLIQINERPTFAPNPRTSRNRTCRAQIQGDLVESYGFLTNQLVVWKLFVKNCILYEIWHLLTSIKGQ